MSKKEDIIRAALKLFNSQSYHSVGVDWIISESNVAKMTFYKYFPSKEKLIEECLRQRHTDLQNALHAALAQCQPIEYLAQIKAIFQWYNAWFHSDDFNGCLFQKALEEVIQIYPSTLIPAMQYRIWLMTLIDQLLGNLGIQKPTPLTAFIMSVLDGMTIHAHVDKHTVQIDEYWLRIEHLIAFEQRMTDVIAQ